MTLGLYIHVPFCGRKCAYCDFYSVSWTRQRAEDYTTAVLRNIRHYGDRAQTVDTVYFGGGTPSLLTSVQLKSIINEINGSFALDGAAEITIEANPCTLTPQKLEKLRSIGINRLSIGVQSMSDNELKLLGRVHTAERAERAVIDAAEAGFGNISCDMMIALPDQTADDIHFSIDRLTALPIQHISAYILKTEAGTPFDCEEIRSRLPDEERTAELYAETVRLLEEKGFMQYEISNFAREGFESRHNCRYWKCQDYLGIGPAAHSCYKGRRFCVERDLEDFINSEVQHTTVTDESPCGYEEIVMLSLRLKEGLRLSDAEEHRAELLKKLPPLIDAGYAETDGERIWLTSKGFLMSNSVIGYLLY